jgi:hypothetical protein
VLERVVFLAVIGLALTAVVAIRNRLAYRWVAVTVGIVMTGYGVLGLFPLLAGGIVSGVLLIASSFAPSDDGLSPEDTADGGP